MAHEQNPVRPVEAESGAADAPAAAQPETADLPAVAEFEPVALAPRHDGWTPERQRAFIEALADCGIVCEAAARVGMSEQSARRLRRRADAAGFSCAWDQAVRIGAEHLRSIAWERAVNGTIRQRYYGGKLVGEERIFDNRLLIYLLGRSAVNGPTGGDLDGRVQGWGKMMGAVEDELPAPLPGPDEDASPLWCDKDGTWVTDFPPPPGFDGREYGERGEQSYCRTLSEEEMAKLDVWREGGLADDDRRRERYFDRLGHRE